MNVILYLITTVSLTSRREYEIQILDREFDPPILVIQEGDRVWWHWEQDKVCITRQDKTLLPNYSLVLLSIHNNIVFYIASYDMK